MRVWAERVCVFCKLGEGSLGFGGGLKGGIVIYSLRTDGNTRWLVIGNGVNRTKKQIVSYLGAARCLEERARWW